LGVAWVFTVRVDVWPEPVRTTDGSEKEQVTLAGTPETSKSHGSREPAHRGHRPVEGCRVS